MILSISYKKRILQLTKQQKAVIRPGEVITVHEKFNGSLELYIRGIQLNYIELKQRPSKPKEAPIVKDRIHRSRLPTILGVARTEGLCPHHQMEVIDVFLEVKNRKFSLC